MLPAAQGFPEHGSLGNRQLNIEAQENQDGTRQKRQAPAEGEKLLVGEPSGKHQENAAGKKESERRAELREHSIPGPLVGRRVLDRQQHSAAPLAAQAEALPEPT